jgi:excinuclease ABC subunit A
VDRNTAFPRSPAPDCIRLRGVRQNNLKGFDLDLPLGRYIVVTGPSGAGKSSLVFDTLHAEGQRRYVETFSAYTRQFLDLLDKPKVDSIENIDSVFPLQIYWHLSRYEL